MNRDFHVILIKHLISFVLVYVHLVSFLIAILFHTSLRLCPLISTLYFPFLPVQQLFQMPQRHAASQHTIRRDKSILFQAKNKVLVGAYPTKATRSFPVSRLPPFIGKQPSANANNVTTPISILIRFCRFLSVQMFDEI